MNRAEEVKKLVQKWNTKGEICDKIHVIDGGCGFSYRRIFEKYMKDDVKEILVDEPYLKEHFQVKYEDNNEEFRKVQCLFKYKPHVSIYRNRTVIWSFFASYFRWNTVKKKISSNVGKNTTNWIEK